MEKEKEQPRAEKAEIFEKIIAFLTARQTQFQVLEHAATRTSEESAAERATPLEWGSKTMLVAGKTGLLLLLYRADRKLSWSKLRKVELLGKKSRMCQAEEVEQLGVLPGAVPPFAALLGVSGIVDSRFREQEKMAFNAGLQGKSVVMNTVDFPFEQMHEADITE